MHAVVAVEVDDVEGGQLGQIRSVLHHPPAFQTGNGEPDLSAERAGGLKEGDEHVGEVVEAISTVAAGGKEHTWDVVADVAVWGGGGAQCCDVERADFGVGGMVVLAGIRFDLP